MRISVNDSKIRGTSWKKELKNWSKSRQVTVFPSLDVREGRFFLHWVRQKELFSVFLEYVSVLKFQAGKDPTQLGPTEGPTLYLSYRPNKVRTFLPLCLLAEADPVPETFSSGQKLDIHHSGQRKKNLSCLLFHTITRTLHSRTHFFSVLHHITQTIARSVLLVKWTMFVLWSFLRNWSNSDLDFRLYTMNTVHCWPIETKMEC